MSISMGRVSQAGGSEAILVDLFEEIARQLQAGEPVDLEAYTRAYPEHAEQLRRLLPAIDVLADLGRSAAKGDPIVALQPAAAESDHGAVGEFRILKEIGRGGMGVVYEAEQLSLGRRVALKVLPFAAALDPKQLQRFKNEAQAAAHLQHWNIVPVYHVGCERGVHFYAMQYIEGQSLAAVIRELRQLAGLDQPAPAAQLHQVSELANELVSGCWAPGKPSGGIGQSSGRAEPTGSFHPHPSFPQQPTPSPAVDSSPPRATVSTGPSAKNTAYFRTVAHLGVQAAEALEHAHQQGVIHRDIKPANLLIDAGGRLWVADFGLAKLGSEAGLTITGDLVGTLRYMSPEQALAQRVAVDARTDVYSLGATLYELATLEPAFAGRDRQEVLRQIAFEEPRSPRRLNAAVPAELETIVLKAMAKSPEERYATAQELADDLRRFLEDKPIRARRPTLAQRARKWARRHRALVWAMGISATVVLLVVIVALAVSNVLIATEQRQTKAAKDELELNLYFNRIQLAEREWAANNMTRVDQVLAECPVELRGWEWNYLRRLRRGGRSRLPLEGMVFCVGFSPEGELLAAGNNPGMVKIWNTRTWQEIRTLPQQKGARFTLAFSPQGHRLATASSECKGPTIWDVDTGRVLFHLPQEGVNGVGQVVFSPDGRWLASIDEGENYRVKIWDANSGRLLFTLPPAGSAHQGLDVRCLAFSPDGQHLAAGSWGRYTVKVWELTTRREVWSYRSPIDPHRSVEFYRVAYSPDGRLLAAAGGYHFSGRPADILIFDAATGGKPIQTLKGHTRSVLGLAFSPDGRRLASGSDDLTVKLWNVATGKEAITLHGHLDSIWDVAFSPDGHRLVSAGADGSVRIWDATPLEDNAGEELRTFWGHTNEVYCLAFSPDGSRLASGSGDLTARIWDVASGKEVQQLGGFTNRVVGVTFSPDGRWLATQSQFHDLGRIIRVWDTRSWQERPSISGGNYTLLFSPDSPWIASIIGDNAGRIVLYDANTGQPRLILPGHDGIVHSVAFSSDGRHLASGSFDTTVKVWNVTPEQEFRPLFACATPAPLLSALVSVWIAQPSPVRRLSGFENCVMAVAFSPDGKRLAAGGMDRMVKIWDTTTWQEERTLRDPFGGVYSLAFSPDGQRIATGGTDTTVKLWDAATGELQRILHGHGHWVSAVVFSPHGERLASSSFDGTVKLWAVSP